MVSQVGINPLLNRALPSISMTGAGNSNSNLFAPNSMTSAGSDYSNDVMMASMDFTKLATAAIQQTAAQAQSNNPTGQVQNPQQTFEANQQQDTSIADGQEPKDSNIAKILCATGGFLAPLAGKLYSWAKGANPANLFKFKQLAITCPILGVAGLGVGMLLDACIDVTRQTKAEKIKEAIQKQSSSLPQRIDSTA